MESFVYEDIKNHERNHWWFKARRKIINASLKELNLPKNIEILEVGCGTGGNLDMLSNFGNINAMEMEEYAVNYAKIKYPNTKKGSLPYNIPFEKKFDLICMFDVLEHIEEDEKSMEVLKKHLKHNGHIIITVPAYQWLYGTHDKFLHHKRRYSINNLKKVLKNYSIIKKTYFNTLLFPLVLLSRLIDKLPFNKDKSIGYGIPNKFLNNLLYIIFKLEKFFINKIYLPFGSSIMIIVKN